MDKTYRASVIFILFITIFVLNGCQRNTNTSKFNVQPVDEIIQAQQFNLKKVRLLDSPFKDAMEKDGEYLLSLDTERLLAPYLEEAGLSPGAEHYGGWESTGLDGHTLGHYLTATSMMYAATGDERYRERVNQIVAQLERAQNEIGTGYLGGVPNGQEIFEQVQSGEINAEPFGLNGGWVPWYNLHKLYAGLRDAYIYADNQAARDILIRLSDWAVETLEPLSDEQFNEMLITEFGGMNEVLADVYAITGDQKYLELSARFNDERIFGPLRNGEDQLEGLHANTQIPKVIGAAREYELTGDESLHKVATFFWDTVVNNRTYVNGGNSQDEHFGELGMLHNRLSKTTSESCNTYNMLKLTEHLMQWNPKNTAYADYYERALYNHILASQDPKTGMVCYFMPLSSGHFKTFSSPENSFWCCVGSGMENHTKYGKNIYLHTENDLYVNLFIPSEVTWNEKGITLRQETEFPKSERTHLTVETEEPVNFTLKIRKPGWVKENISVTLNGESIEPSRSDNYMNIDREWQDGDRVEVQMPMNLRLESFPNSNQKKAVLYGPILLTAKLGTKGMDEEPIPYAGYQNFDGRWDQLRYADMPSVEAPFRIPANEPVENWLIPVEGAPLKFHTDGLDESETIEFAPYYQVNHERYAIYWDVESDGE